MTQQEEHTLADVLRQFLRSEKTQASPAQYAATSQALRLFSNLLRDKYKLSPYNVPAEKLTIAWGRAYLDQLQKTSSVETEHLYSRALLRFFAFAKAHHKTTLQLDTLTHFITDNRRTKSHEIPDIPTDAIAAILSYAQSCMPPANLEPGSRTHLQALRDKAYILTLHDTGLRLSEMCSLRVDQLDLPRNAIQLAADLAAQISTATAASLRLYLRERQRNLRGTTSDPLFARHDKRAGSKVLPISRWTGANIVTFWVQQALPLSLQHDLEEKAQPITTNTFRHYFVQRHLINDETLQTIQKLARHSDIGTTRRYLKTMPDTPELTDE